MALLTYEWHPPDPSGAVNAWLAGVRAGQAERAQAAHERQVAQKMAADAIEQDRLRKRFEQQHALQLQQEARLAGAEKLRQAYQTQKMTNEAGRITGERTAADSIINSFDQNQPTLPTASAPGDPAASLVAPDPSDPLVGQPPPLDPEDNATADDFAADAAATVATPAAAAAGEEDQFQVDPVTGTPKLIKAGKGTTGAAMLAIPRDAKGKTIPGALPTAGTADGANPLLSPTAGYTPAPKRAGVPDMATLLRALPPKDVIAVARNAAAAQLRQSTGTGPGSGTMKPIVRTMADGTTRQYDAASDSWTVIASKPGAQTRDAYMQENYPDGVTAVPEHGTYKRGDGTEFFLNRTATGKISERAFDPERHPARMIDGTDGKKYPVDATGEPMQPLPDGVSLGKFVQPHYSNVKGVGAVMIDSAGEGHVVIPEGLSMPTKAQADYLDAAKAVAVAKDKLDAQKELLRTKPGFFGGSKKSVDQAQAELDAATKAAAVYVETYPQLKAHALATAGVPDGAPAGDDKVSVISPDGKPGKIPRSQLEAALKAGYRKQ